MDNDKLLLLATPEDLNYPLNLCARTIGVDNIYKLAEIAGGRSIYIPKPDLVLKALKKRLIIAEYRKDGCSADDLAKKYDISVKSIYNYING